MLVAIILSVRTSTPPIIISHTTFQGAIKVHKDETHLINLESKNLNTSTDFSGGSELKARSNRARTFLSSFKRHKKSAYLQENITLLEFSNAITEVCKAAKRHYFLFSYVNQISW